MEAEKIGMLIRQLRRERGMTQAQLAEVLHVSDKAISKWERGAGCPDVSLVPALSRFFGVTAENLLNGSIRPSATDGGNMKRIRVYQCPVCGNLLTATSPAEIACCGRRLTPLEAQAPDAAHAVHVAPVEDEWLLTFDHPMEKAHHLSFLLEVGYDRVALVRLYPEGGHEFRMPRLPGGRFLVGCGRHGLFRMADPRQPGRQDRVSSGQAGDCQRNVE